MGVADVRGAWSREARQCGDVGTYLYVSGGTSSRQVVSGERRARGDS